jgi:hypothetical protein
MPTWGRRKLMDVLGVLLGAGGILVVLLMLLVACREIICWFWKINEALDTLRSIEEKLSVQINIMTRSQTAEPILLSQPDEQA